MTDPTIDANCLILGDVLTKKFLILRVRCSDFFSSVNEIFIFLESIKNARSSIFCIDIKTDLLVCIKKPKLQSKSVVVFILIIHSCLVSPCK